MGSSHSKTSDDLKSYLLNDFQHLTLLAQGGQGIIWKGYDAKKRLEHHNTEISPFRPFAIKEFTRWWDSYSEREIAILSKCNHPHIIKLCGIILDRQEFAWELDPPNLCGYVMEYTKLGDLNSEIHNAMVLYDNRLVALWIRQIGSALLYLHENGIIHRDVKPHNILLAARDHLKLADFGVARQLSDITGSRPPTTGTGTCNYRALEVLCSHDYGPPADVFSFGITIWEIIHRRPPLKQFNCKVDDDGNVAVLLPIELKKLDEITSTLLKRCWESGESARPSLKEIIECFDLLAKNELLFYHKEYERENPHGNDYNIVSDGSIYSSLSDIGDDFCRTILLMNVGHYGDKMLVWNRAASDWIIPQLKIPPDSNSSGGVASLFGELYLIARQSSRKDLLKLDSNLHWTQLADMNVARRWIANSCVEWKGYIWVFGGYGTGRKFLNSVERYDPGLNKWTLMREMKYCRAFAAAAACNLSVYVCGGWGEDKRPLRSVECYDSVSDLWIEVMDLPRPRAGHYLTACGNKLILTGGHNGKKYNFSILEMEPLTENGKWKKLPPPRAPRPRITGIALEQAMFTIGGGQAYSNPLQVEIFDGNSWQEGPPLPLDSLFPSALLIPQFLADRLFKHQDVYAYFDDSEDEKISNIYDIVYEINSTASSSSFDSIATISRD